MRLCVTSEEFSKKPTASQKLEFVQEIADRVFGPFCGLVVIAQEVPFQTSMTFCPT
jgi:hypothetical protein